MLISIDIPKKILDKFGMSNLKLIITPTNPQFKLSMTQSPSIEVRRPYMNNISYASIIGSLMYDMVCTMLDMVYGVSIVSKYMANLGKVY